MLIKNAIIEYEKWKGLTASKPTMRGYSMSLRQFAVFVGSRRHVENITIHDITDWFSEMVEMGWDSNSFLPKASALRDFFKFLSLNKYNTLDPRLITIPRKTHKPIEVIRADDFQKALQYLEATKEGMAKKRDMAIFWLLWDTGMRVGEVCSLNVEQIDNGKALIKTEKAKHSRPYRTVIWSQQAQICVEDWLNDRLEIETDHNALFIGLDTRREYKRLSTRNVQRVVKEVSDNLKLPTLTPHTFRHSKAHRIIEKGGSGADVMNVLGHSNLSTSSRYVEMAGNELETRAKLFI